MELTKTIELKKNKWISPDELLATYDRCSGNTEQIYKELGISRAQYFEQVKKTVDQMVKIRKVEQEELLLDTSREALEKQRKIQLSKLLKVQQKAVDTLFNSVIKNDGLFGLTAGEALLFATKSTELINVLQKYSDTGDAALTEFFSRMQADSQQDDPIYDAIETGRSLRLPSPGLADND